MFKEGHFNLVMLQVSTPQDASSDEYPRYKAFIDRCHDNGIRVTFDGRAGGQPIRLNSISADSVKANPVKEAWLSRNENGILAGETRELVTGPISIMQITATGFWKPPKR